MILVSPSDKIPSATENTRETRGNLAPADEAQFSSSQTIRFNWPSVPTAKYYRLLIEDLSGNEIFSAIVRETHSYGLPPWLLFRPEHTALRWRVVAFSDGDKVRQHALCDDQRIAPPSLSNLSSDDRRLDQFSACLDSENRRGDIVQPYRSSPHELQNQPSISYIA